MSKTETILCQPVDLIKMMVDNKTGFIPKDSVNDDKFFDSNRLWFIPRPIAEENTDFRQLIPYVILRYKDRIGIYERTSKGGENRLHNLVSIGMGGHVSTRDIFHYYDDIHGLETVKTAMFRELIEEIGLTDEHIDSINHVGYLYYDKDSPVEDVHKVHIGVVLVCNILKLPESETEDAIGNFKFIPLADLKEYRSSMERWSKEVSTYLV